jgi:hypothetical protein
VLRDGTAAESAWLREMSREKAGYFVGRSSTAHFRRNLDPRQCRVVSNTYLVSVPEYFIGLGLGFLSPFPQEIP